MCVRASVQECVCERETGGQRQRLRPGECWIVSKFKLGKLL